MKTFKGILFLILNIILLMSNILLASTCCYYLIPGVPVVIEQVGAGEFIRSIWGALNLTPQSVFWITIVCAMISVVLFIVNFIIGRYLNPKYKNIFIRINSWVLTCLIIGLSVYTFICVSGLEFEKIVNNAVKIGVGILLGLIILSLIFASKIKPFINRKIQAYETAKEMNEVSIMTAIIANFLKLFELLFIEILILILLCFLVDWSVACYFVTILISCVIPVIGNIACDINSIRYNNLLEKLKMVKIGRDVKGDRK